jgi:hypothetical protein
MTAASNKRWRVRERPVVMRRGPGKTVCARSAYPALLGGPPTSPLDGTGFGTVPASQCANASHTRRSWLIGACACCRTTSDSISS